MNAGTPRRPSFAGFVGERIRVFLHGVTDKDQGAHPQELGFFLRVLEHFLNLGMTSLAHDLRHGLGQLLGALDPARAPALAQTPVIDQLHVEATSGGDLPEHLAL